MRWLVLSTMVFFAATCGQKGPLTRPTNEPAYQPMSSQLSPLAAPKTDQDHG